MAVTRCLTCTCAALAAGLLTVCIPAYPEEPGDEFFQLESSASLQVANGKFEPAIAAYRRFAEENDGTAIAALALLMAGQIQELHGTDPLKVREHYDRAARTAGEDTLTAALRKRAELARLRVDATALEKQLADYYRREVSYPKSLDALPGSPALPAELLKQFRYSARPSPLFPKLKDQEYTLQPADELKVKLGKSKEVLAEISDWQGRLSIQALSRGSKGRIVVLSDSRSGNTLTLSEGSKAETLELVLVGSSGTVLAGEDFVLVLLARR